MPSSVIQSYLVSLGFQVNNNELQQAQKALGDLGSVVQKTTEGMSKAFSGSASVVVGALAAITSATVGMVAEVAKADIQYEKLATRMWTTKDVAKDLKTVLDVMGESFEDVALNPELRNQFMELRDFGRSLQTPMDASGQLSGIRQLLMEFNKLRLASKYAMEWIAYYLVKYLQEPLAKVKEVFADMTGGVQLSMDVWTKYIAEGLAMIVTAFINVGRAAKGLWGGLSSLIETLPPKFHGVAKAAAALWLVFKLTPIGRVTALIIAAVVAIDDFFAYTDGRKSSKTLAPIWAQLISWFKSLSGILQPLKELFQQVNDAIADLLDTMVKEGILEEVVLLFKQLGSTVTSLILGIVNLTKGVVRFFGVASGNQATRSLWDWFKGTVVFIVKMVLLLTRSFLSLFDIIGLAMQGKFAEAAKKGKDILSSFRKDMDALFKTPTAYASGKKGAGGGYKGGRSYQGGGGGNSEFEALVEAISGQESGGNYDAVNERTGAAGRFQIMPDNWPSWSEEAGLPSGSPMTPENQDLVGRYKLRQYYDKYGARGAAIAWYGGEGALDYSDYAMNRAQGNGDEPSLNEYADSVLSRMGETHSPQAYAPSYEAPPVIDHSQDPFEKYKGTGGVTAASFQGGTTPSLYGMASGATGGNTITVGDININQPNATPDQIRIAVADGIRESQSSQISLQQRELSGVLA